MISIHITTVYRMSSTCTKQLERGGILSMIALGGQACKKKDSKQVLTPPPIPPPLKPKIFTHQDQLPFQCKFPFEWSHYSILMKCNDELMYRIVTPTCTFHALTHCLGLRGRCSWSVPMRCSWSTEGLPNTQLAVWETIHFHTPMQKTSLGEDLSNNKRTASPSACGNYLWSQGGREVH